MALTTGDILSNIADPVKKAEAKAWFASAPPEVVAALLQAASKSERPNLHELINGKRQMTLEVKSFMSAIRTQLRQWMIAAAPVENTSPASGSLSIELTEDSKLNVTFNGKWAPKKENKKKEEEPKKQPAAAPVVEYEDEDTEEDIDLEDDDEE